MSYALSPCPSLSALVDGVPPFPRAPQMLGRFSRPVPAHPQKLKRTWHLRPPLHKPVRLDCPHRRPRGSRTLLGCVTNAKSYRQCSRKRAPRCTGVRRTEVFKWKVLQEQYFEEAGEINLYVFTLFLLILFKQEGGAERSAPCTAHVNSCVDAQF